MRSRIPYTKPSITEIEVRYGTDALANGWSDKCYQYIHRFADLFKQPFIMHYTIANSSCTGAFHMGMAALGSGPNGEVIMGEANKIVSAVPAEVW